MADRAGEQLGNYRLLRLLGKGGFAEVYLGKHIYLNTNAAIKILRVRLASGDEGGFLNEARMIAGLVHPHIVRVLDFGVEDNTPYLVMDYAPNGTLRQHHPRGTILPLLTIVSYTRQIAEALQYAHSKKLIHRDIKPENLLLGPNNEILLSDFGTALLVQTVHNESLHEMAGTVTYMAPEQIQGKPRLASDQYGLAVVVYEWLCGECPFRGSFMELFSQHMSATPPSLREKAPAIPADVEHVVMTALAKDPQRRFGSIKAFANALEQAYLVEQPTIASAPYMSSSQTLRSPEEKRTAVLPSTPAGKDKPDSMSFTTLDENRSEEYNTAILPPDSSGKGTPAPASSSTPSDRAAAITPVLSDSSIHSAPPVLSTPAPKKGGISRRSVVLGLTGLATIGVASGGAIIYLPKIFRHVGTIISRPTPVPTIAPSQIGQPTIYTYIGHLEAVNGVDWSPDSKRVVSGSADYSVKVWDAATGSVVFMYQHTAQVKAVAWSPDGRYIASASKDKTIQIWDAITKKHAATCSGHKGFVNGVAWSHDSRHIVSGSSDKTVRIWDALTGTAVAMNRHLNVVNAVAWSPNGKYIASGSADHTVQVLDAATGNPVGSFTRHRDQVKDVAWSPDSTHVVSGSIDGTAQVWEAPSGHLLYAYNEPFGAVHAVAWSPVSGMNLIATGSEGGHVQAWDASTGVQAFFHDGQTGQINALAWSPDGTGIASASGDKTVQIWKAAG